VGAVAGSVSRVRLTPPTLKVVEALMIRVVTTLELTSTVAAPPSVVVVTVEVVSSPVEGVPFVSVMVKTTVVPSGAGPEACGSVSWRPCRPAVVLLDGGG